VVPACPSNPSPYPSCTILEGQISQDNSGYIRPNKSEEVIPLSCIVTEG
jgi:hypothetical protein